MHGLNEPLKPRSIRVLLAEDDYLYAQALTMALEHDDRIEIVGHAGDGAEAFVLCAALEPDVVVMDLFMPRMDGAESTARIREALPKTRVIALTSSRSPDDARLLRAAGADACVAKDAVSSDLTDLVHAIVRAAVIVRPVSVPAELATV